MLAHGLGLAVFSLLVVLPATAGAEILTFAMEGPITFKDDRLGLLDFAEVGNRVVYTFSFDTEAPDSNPDVSGGEYTGLDGSLRIVDASFTTVASFETAAPVIAVQKPNLFDVIPAMEVVGETAHLLLRLWDSDQSAIQSPALPTMAYDLALFEDKYFSAYVDVVPPVPPDVNFTRLTFGGEIDRFYSARTGLRGHGRSGIDDVSPPQALTRYAVAHYVAFNGAHARSGLIPFHLSYWRI